ncbi:MAG: PVC-type heme-binding CxxCH protein [Gemmataceae bacterium]
MKKLPWWGMASGLLVAALAYFLASGHAQNAADKHDPAQAVANLDVHPELQATLFASEPVLTNPTNLDIDSRGRVWVCDVMNYRGNNGKRPEGDRILILEDTTGDGVADKHTVYYQGRDVDSAMGICVLGNKVIVSCSPHIIIFTDENGDDKPDKKEYLFTKTGQPQHDHSAHSFIFGPDGKYYWNFGNTGKAVHDKDGKLVVDQAGNPVVDNGKPYWGGMVFRCNPDGSEFEVLAHNFRNNYEVTVDSFGTLWQSDNDDDGNRGVRINYVMEFGNYGYRDELTGAGWNTPRTHIEADIPSRHWHQNDPGVVPNLLHTGQGSPTGICVYEGKLLPRVFHNQVIHCDAGPSIVRAYPVIKDGAGYQAEIVNILDGSKKNNWFRPADVCVAPDGSLFVTDWYDPGVGGHAQRDLDRGRIFRVAPPGSKYQVPRFDFQTARGAAEALKNPNLAVRYLAWTALHDFGAKAESELLKLWQSDDARLRARALWLLGKIAGKGPHYVNLAIQDQDPDIRLTGIRLARQLHLDIIPVLRKLVHDKAPEVRRECAIALRFTKSPDMPALWVELAKQHDGKDRWYLEALGIGAESRWDDCLMNGWPGGTLNGFLGTPAGRDLIWRSRSPDFTPLLLERIIADAKVPTAELPRYFRAFDFQQGPKKQEALRNLVVAAATVKEERETFIVLEAAQRLPQGDARQEPRLAAALEKVLAQHRGTDTYIQVVKQFGLSQHYPEVLHLAQHQPDQQLGVNAVKALLDRGQHALLRQGLDSKDDKLALATLQALHTTADDRATPLLMALVRDRQRDLEQRRLAVRAVTRTRNGALALLKLAQAGDLGEELKQVAGFALHVAPWNDVKGPAAQLFPLPPAKDDKPLPPFAELVKLRGDPARGHKIFATAGTCANCHLVNGQGKEVGPDLSEIGNKLSREALLESILYPSAGISHNYETYLVELKSGNIETGLLASDTPEAVVLKGADGILRTLPKGDIEQMIKSPNSLMPADLHKQLTPQDLADLVDYMLTLKKAAQSPGGK